MLLEDVGILHRARMKICTFEPFPAYGKMGVNQKIFSRHKLMMFYCFKVTKSLKYLIYLMNYCVIAALD